MAVYLWSSGEKKRTNDIDSFCDRGGHHRIRARRSAGCVLSLYAGRPPFRRSRIYTPTWFHGAATGLYPQHEFGDGGPCTALSLLLDARMRIYLASSSPRRAHMLADWGIPFSVVKADMDEVMLGAAPEKSAAQNALAKARSGSDHVDAGLVAVSYTHLRAHETRHDLV